MKLLKGTLVMSLAGHDRGTLFYVLCEEGRFVWLADGKRRSLSHPKRKSRRHIAVLDGGAVCSCFAAGGPVSDLELRRALAAVCKK